VAHVIVIERECSLIVFESWYSIRAPATSPVKMVASNAFSRELRMRPCRSREITLSPVEMSLRGNNTLPAAFLLIRR
jgi:hypothetical protein